MKTDKQLANELMKLMGGDCEIDHGNADDFVCEVLRSLGYVELSKTYNDLTNNFWYA